MPENIASIVVLSLFVGISVFAFVSLLVKLIKNRVAPVRTVKAVVLDKQKVEIFSKYSGTGKQEKYVVVFSLDGKKKSFYVSQFSYGGYRLSEKGTLKYQGDKLIDFT